MLTERVICLKEMLNHYRPGTSDKAPPSQQKAANAITY